MTYHEYALLPQDRNRYEILDGELYMTPSPSVEHQLVVAELTRILAEHVAKRGLGKVIPAPMDVVLGETNVVQPDILFIRTDRLPPRKAKNIQVPPDLIVEVVSPSSVEQDRGDKKHVYARHGIAHYWIVDPEARRLEMYTLSRGSYELSADFTGQVQATTILFPGLVIPLPALWA